MPKSAKGVKSAKKKHETCQKLHKIVTKGGLNFLNTVTQCDKKISS